MGRFDEYITGMLEITVGKEDLQLDVQIEDKRKLKALVGKTITEKELKVVDDTVLEILYRSYPKDNKEGLKGFYFDNDTDFTNELFIRFGWLKREDLEEKKQEA